MADDEERKSNVPLGTFSVSTAPPPPGPAESGGEETGLAPGSVPDAIAVLVIEPAVRSARITVRVAMQVIDSAAARFDCGQGTPGSLSSATARLLMSTLPVLVTT